MKKNEKTTATTTAEELQNIAHAAAHIAIRARHQASGLKFLDQLNRMQYADRRRENITDTAAQALQARADHATHRAAAEEYQRIADRVTTPTMQAEAAAIMARFEREAAAEAIDTARSLERIIETTSHSDRADISQAAALAWIEFTVEHTAAEYDTAEEYTQAAFAAACKAAGRAIGAVAAAAGLTATRTKVERITEADAERIRNQYPNTDRIPFAVREGMAAGYTTIEYRNTPRFPAGWYAVKHYITTAPCISYETFATGEEAATRYTTNGGINAIADEGDSERINALFDKIGLSERERLLCRYMADNTAAAAGIKAVGEHMRKTAERIAAASNAKYAQEIQREADRQTASIRAAAQRENAFDRAGIYSDSNRRKVLQRIRAKVEKFAPEYITK